eukprot:TRINITY_DN15081_c1_g2_i1.p1 TRINITY_DN15081_c1_g2~~TRINITY_DN15081_c1_g2_i1.p1  ORF type:complete len:104 (-),score=8.03 TRINITY_DN15081_c1_g2_i1:580-891(-)
MGFGEKWSQWTKECVSSACFSIIINGSPTGFIQAQRDITQGDPLSPFLFVIVAEALNMMIKAVTFKELISGFKVYDSVPPTSICSLRMTLLSFVQLMKIRYKM